MQIKLERARATSDVGKYPSTCSAMMRYIPPSVAAKCSSSELAQLLDAITRACRDAKDIAEREIVENGVAYGFDGGAQMTVYKLAVERVVPLSQAPAA